MKHKFLVAHVAYTIIGCAIIILAPEDVLLPVGTPIVVISTLALLGKIVYDYKKADDATPKWNGEFGENCNLPIDCVDCDITECPGRESERKPR